MVDHGQRDDSGKRANDLQQETYYIHAHVLIYMYTLYKIHITRAAVPF